MVVASDELLREAAESVRARESAEAAEVAALVERTRAGVVDVALRSGGTLSLHQATYGGMCAPRAVCTKPKHLCSLFCGERERQLVNDCIGALLEDGTFNVVTKELKVVDWPTFEASGASLSATYVRGYAPAMSPAVVARAAALDAEGKARLEEKARAEEVARAERAEKKAEKARVERERAEKRAAQRQREAEERAARGEQAAASATVKAAAPATSNASPRGGKKEPSPYIQFCKQARPSLVAAYPQFSFGEVGMALGSRWAALSADERHAFSVDAAAAFARLETDWSRYTPLG